MSYQKTLNVISSDYSFYDKIPLSYVLRESGFKGLPEIVILYLGELLKQY
jgi:hypothetical protein